MENQGLQAYGSLHDWIECSERPWPYLNTLRGVLSLTLSEVLPNRTCQPLVELLPLLIYESYLVIWYVHLGKVTLWGSCKHPTSVSWSHFFCVVDQLLSPWLRKVLAGQLPRRSIFELILLGGKQVISMEEFINLTFVWFFPLPFGSFSFFSLDQVGIWETLTS